MALRDDVKAPLKRHPRVWAINLLRIGGVKKIQVELHPEADETLEQLQAVKDELVSRVPPAAPSDFDWREARVRPTSDGKSPFKLQSRSFGVCASPALPQQLLGQQQATDPPSQLDASMGVHSSVHSGMSDVSNPLSRSVSGSNNANDDDAGTGAHTRAGVVTFYFLLYEQASLTDAAREQRIQEWRQLSFSDIQKATQASIGLVSDFHVLFPATEADALLQDSNLNEFQLFERAADLCNDGLSTDADVNAPCVGLCDVISTNLGRWRVNLKEAEFSSQTDFAFCDPLEAFPHQWTAETQHAILHMTPTFVGTLKTLSELVAEIPTDARVEYRTATGIKHGTVEVPITDCDSYIDHIAIVSGTDPTTVSGDSGALVTQVDDDGRRTPIGAHRLRSENGGLQLAVPLILFLEALQEAFVDAELIPSEDFIWVLQ